VGGVKDADDWFPSPRAGTTDDILRRGLALCPELAPPHIREKRSPEELTVEDVRPLVVEEGCGLRPARRGGIRLEVEWIPAGPNSGTRVPVVFNYGCVPRRGLLKRAACKC
jgi:D-amino-acid oxidase